MQHATVSCAHLFFGSAKMAPKGGAQLQADGPRQLGGCPGQYVYLIVFSHPKDGVHYCPDVSEELNSEEAEAHFSHPEHGVHYLPGISEEQTGEEAEDHSE